MPNYRTRVKSALDEVSSRRSWKEIRELDELRMVVFSDHHRGQLDGADDFRAAQAAYHAALAYYHASGYELALLGDVEELWECTPQRVVKAYRESLELEARFASHGRLLRFVGNHDDLWLSPRAVASHLGPYLAGRPGTDARPTVLEGLVLELEDKTQPIGRVFLTHGHQGSATSDRYSRWSRRLVRHLWRPIQRLSKIRLATPAKDYSLRRKHELALFAWAAEQQRTVLITGHTHQPIFPTRLYEELLLTELERLEHQARDNDLSGEALADTTEELATRSAELHWTRAKGLSSEVNRQSKPCYFNSGCCCYPDGQITGLELADGEIRLVRWPDRVGGPRRWVLQRADLRAVLARCNNE